MLGAEHLGAVGTAADFVPEGGVYGAGEEGGDAEAALAHLGGARARLRPIRTKVPTEV